jgi:hypothetical protein
LVAWFSFKNRRDASRKETGRQSFSRESYPHHSPLFTSGDGNGFLLKNRQNLQAACDKYQGRQNPRRKNFP